jgi:hypothetical protein
MQYSTVHCISITIIHFKTVFKYLLYDGATKSICIKREQQNTVAKYQNCFRYLYTVYAVLYNCN